MPKTHYKADAKLGEKYTDPQTGITGTATSIHFYQYGCERVTLEFVKSDGELQELTFDVPRLEKTKAEGRLTTDRTGGPGSIHERSKATPQRGVAR